jgi:hypothetical protein
LSITIIKYKLMQGTGALQYFIITLISMYNLFGVENLWMLGFITLEIGCEHH